MGPHVRPFSFAGASMKRPKERRFNGECGLRSIAPVDGGVQPKIAGHAAVFNSLSEDLWGFREKITPGAFGEALVKSDIRALLNHDPNYVLGRTKNGTLRAWEDDTGLAVEIDPPRTRWAGDLLVSIERGDISQMSFAFRVGEEEWGEVDGVKERTIVSFDEIFDVSAVTYPAYPETDVSVRTGLLLEEVDPAQLDVALVRAGTRAGMQPEDSAIIGEYLRILRFLIDPPPGEMATIEDPRDRPRGRSISQLKRRLRLLELENSFQGDKP
jgi:HK97 family phage prohead protease